MFQSKVTRRGRDGSQVVRLVGQDSVCRRGAPCGGSQWALEPGKLMSACCPKKHHACMRACVCARLLVVFFPLVATHLKPGYGWLCLGRLKP